MFVEVVAIEQRMSLKTKETQNYLRLRMPNADELVVEVPEDDIMRLLKADQDTEQPGHAIASPPDGATTKNSWAQPWGDGQEDHVSIAEPPPLVEEPIHWRDLTDEVLPAVVKDAFERADLPEVLTVAQITSFAHRVMETMAEPPNEQVEPPPAGKVVPIRPEPDVDDVTGIPQV